MLAAYLHALANIRATGAATAETSYYTPLENLLNAVGAQLKPPVRAVFLFNDLGAGRPDFGLFAARQNQSQYLPCFRNLKPITHEYPWSVDGRLSPACVIVQPTYKY